MSLLEFHFRHRQQDYTVMIKADTRQIFESFALQNTFNSRSLRGEALIDALLRHSMPGDIRGVTILRGEKEHNGPKGRAAVTAYDEKGVLRQVQYKENGALHGKDAHVFYYASGKPREAFHYLNGRENDTDGEAALRRWNENGSLRYREWLAGGLQHDGPNGFQNETFDDAGNFVKGETMADIEQRRQNAKTALQKTDMKGARERITAENEAREKLESQLTATYGRGFKLY